MPIEPLHISTRTNLLIRPAQAGDRPALEAIAAQTWNGHDYLPGMIDKWLADPHDGFYVATLDGLVVGAIKLTRLAEGEWWLEGLRVDPAFQGRGYARIMHHFVMHEFHRRGSGVVRLSTASMSEAVHALVRESGFRHVATFLPYAADPLAEPVQGWKVLGVDDVARVRAWLDASDYFTQAQRSIEWDWSYYLLSDVRLSERLAAGLVYGWMPAGSGDLAGVLIVNPPGQGRWEEEKPLKVAFFDAAADQVETAARAIRRLGATLDRGWLDFKVLKLPERVAALERAGWTRDWEGEVWLYARDASLTEHAEVRTDSAEA